MVNDNLLDLTYEQIINIINDYNPSLFETYPYPSTIVFVKGSICTYSSLSENSLFDLIIKSGEFSDNILHFLADKVLVPDFNL